MSFFRGSFALVLAATLSSGAAVAGENPCGTDDATCIALLRRRELHARTRVVELERQLSTGAAQRSAAELEQQRLRERMRADADGERRVLVEQIAALGKDVEETRRLLDQMKRAREASDRRSAQFRELVDKLRAMTDAGTLQVEVRDGLLLLKLPDNILFNPGKTDIKPAGREAITRLTQVLSGLGRKLQVAGHTDNIPIKSKRFRSNWELSTARAVEVVRLMISVGMDPARLSAAGYANQLPIAANDGADGRMRNRRIEIVVVPNLDELLSTRAVSDATPPKP